MSLPSSPRQAGLDSALCLVFFTRLPLPHFDFGDRRLADAIWAAPLAGLVVALVGGIVSATAERLGLAAGPSAALVLTATLFVTGALHEDGLADVADGFGGGQTRERRLEIMRDSRIGAYGAAALVLSLLVRWTVLAGLHGAWHLFLALIAAEAGSRGLAGLLMHALPPARSDGLSVGAGSVTRETATLGAVIGAGALLTLGLSAALAALVLLAVLFLAFRVLCLSRIGGQTGDTVGALQQLAAIVILLVASASSA
jgi:adenosylcobinamide-GDP ribazoletransferase